MIRFIRFRWAWIILLDTDRISGHFFICFSVPHWEGAFSVSHEWAPISVSLSIFLPISISLFISFYFSQSFTLLPLFSYIHPGFLWPFAIIAFSIACLYTHACTQIHFNTNKYSFLSLFYLLCQDKVKMLYTYGKLWKWSKSYRKI